MQKLDELSLEEQIRKAKADLEYYTGLNGQTVKEQYMLDGLIHILWDRYMYLMGEQNRIVRLLLEINSGHTVPVCLYEG